MRQTTLLVICALVAILFATTAWAQIPADVLKVDYFANANTASAPDGTLRIIFRGATFALSLETKQARQATLISRVAWRVVHGANRLRAWVSRRLAPDSASNALMQPRLRQHFQELPSGAHVDRLRHKFAAAIVHKGFGNAFHLKKFVYLTAGI
jgi:hypothetical protein